MALYNLFFFIFAFLLLSSALAVVLVRNPVYSVLLLIFAFFNAAGLFILLGAEFLAAVLVIVYVGAVAVLFLFVIMMLNLDSNELRNFKEKYSLLAILGSIIFLGYIAFALYAHNKIGIELKGLGAYKISTMGSSSNIKQIGEILYTDLAIAFWLGGLVLFVAMVAAIVLTFKKTQNPKRQDVSLQLARSKENSVRLVKVKKREGVDAIF